MNIFKSKQPYTAQEVTQYVTDLVELTKLRNQAEQNSRMLAPDKGGREALEQWNQYNEQIDCAQKAHLFMMDVNNEWLMKRSKRK